MVKANSTRKLINAIKKGDAETVSEILEEAVDFTAQVEGIPPLGWAVHANQPEIARLLLEAGAAVNGPNSASLTPLQSCAAIRANLLSDEDSVTMAKLLIEYGADVMECTNKNHDCAPLPMAKSRGKKKLAALLKKHGAVAFHVTVAVQDERGKPLDGEFHFGIPGGDYPIVEVNRSGKLKLENVFPGKFVVGYDGGDEQEITIHDDGSTSPTVLRWKRA